MTHFSERELALALVRTARKNFERATKAAEGLRKRAADTEDRAGREQLLAHAMFYGLEAQRAQRELQDLERLRIWRDAQVLRELYPPVEAHQVSSGLSGSVPEDRRAPRAAE